MDIDYNNAKFKEYLTTNAPKQSELDALESKYTSYTSIDPIAMYKDKREVDISDGLLNEKQFINFWKQRNKKLPADEKPYLYAKKDLDGDSVADFLAYRVNPSDTTKIDLYGYNNIFTTEPKENKFPWKRDYYAESAEYRQQRSFADYFENNYTSSHQDYIDEKNRKKIAEKIEKALITKVKEFFKDSFYYKKLRSASKKTEVANHFIDIISQSMYDKASDPVQVQFLKKQPKFAKAKYELAEKLMKQKEIIDAKDNIINAIVHGQTKGVREMCRYYAGKNGLTLSVGDVDQIFTVLSQRKFMRSGKATLSDDDAGAARLPYYSYVADNYRPDLFKDYRPIKSIDLNE